jgi:hypothetical protein
MRSFFAISLALVAGCGDNLSGPKDPPSDQAPTSGVQGTDEVARLVPQVCGVRAWNTAQFDAKDSTLRAVATVNGAAVFMVPNSGGMLRGFEVDGRGLIRGDQHGQKIRSDGVYTGLSATRVDDRYVVNLVSGDHVSVNVVRDDLQDFRELAVVDGAFVGDTAMMHARNVRMTTTGGPAGMVTSSFDANWAPMGSEVAARSVPVSMTSAAYQNDGMMAWSTTSECHLQRIASGIESMQPYPCRNGRLAVSYEDRGGWMVYESGNRVMIAQIAVDGHNQIANERQLVRFGRSPRIAFDGARYWVSYIDAHSDLVAGFLDETGELTSTAIEGTQPMADAYDLAVVGGGAWLYAIDGTGVGATRMCATAL